MRAFLVAGTLVLLAGCAGHRPVPAPADPRQQVMAAERAFAATMASRDFDGFKRFLAEDSVFIAGDKPLRGKARVAAGWKAFFETREAPFSWEPQAVEVLEGGSLALSSGPVRNPQGKVVATFTSIWQLQGGGWKVIFDKGNRACD